tara:strand:- start:762 stop:1169 length:408 start_codon:yes stop_codon:yes gene_type:complete
MAGETAVPVQEYPDICDTIVVIPGHDGDGVVSNNQALFYAERDTVLDGAAMRATVGDDDATFTLEVCADGTAPGSGTDCTNALTHATSNNNKALSWTITETENLIPAGSALCMHVGGTSTARLMCIVLRLRTKIR